MRGSKGARGASSLRDPAWWLFGLAAVVFAAVPVLQLPESWAALGRVLMGSALAVEGARRALVGGAWIPRWASCFLLVGGFAVAALSLVQMAACWG